MNMSSAAIIDFQNNTFVEKLLVSGGLGATSGALAGHFFQIISPVGGAVFGAAFFFAADFVAKELNKFLGNSKREEVVGAIGSLFLSAVTGTALVNYGLGLSLSMVNAIHLTGTTLLMAFTTAFVLGIIQDRFK